MFKKGVFYNFCMPIIKWYNKEEEYMIIMYITL